jgi:hypothetical protein
MFMQIMHVVQQTGNHHAFAGGLLQRPGIAVCGLMQKCASPAREAGLPTLEFGVMNPPSVAASGMALISAS